jgi:hypothetical protein
MDRENIHPNQRIGTRLFWRSGVQFAPSTKLVKARQRVHQTAVKARKKMERAVETEQQQAALQAVVDRRAAVAVQNRMALDTLMAEQAQDEEEERVATARREEEERVATARREEERVATAARRAARVVKKAALEAQMAEDQETAVGEEGTHTLYPHYSPPSRARTSSRVTCLFSPLLLCHQVSRLLHLLWPDSTSMGAT